MTPPMDAPRPGDAPPDRPLRSDGEAARERLLQAGLALFARQGYDRTSTRELAEAAGVNVAAISYYFGDKAGLLRAVSQLAVGDVDGDAARMADPALTLEQALQVFYRGFLEPLRDGDAAQLCMKLHFREMLEPTGLWHRSVAESIRPQHEAMVTLLCRHLGLAGPDDEIRRLAVCLSALGVHQHVGRIVVDELMPTLNAAPDAIDRWIDTLVRLGLAMVQDEQQRRRPAAAVRPVVRRATAAGGARTAPSRSPKRPTNAKNAKNAKKRTP